MKQPEGFVIKGKKELVCKLKRSLYGLNKSSRISYQNFDTYILSLGFVRKKLITAYITRKKFGVSYM